jgi:hypothetical protein
VEGEKTARTVPGVEGEGAYLGESSVMGTPRSARYDVCSAMSSRATSPGALLFAFRSSRERVFWMSMHDWKAGRSTVRSASSAICVVRSMGKPIESYLRAKRSQRNS